MTMKIKARSRTQSDSEWREITPEKLAAFCLHRCGGGYTVAQTAKAMLMQRKILDGEPYVTKTIEVVAEPIT